MKSKLLKIILVIAVIFIVAMGYLYLTGKIGQKKEVKEESVNSAVSSVETADWKTYKNEKYGFEFKYPKKLKLSQSKDTVSLDEENFIINIYPEKFIIDWNVKETCSGEQIGDTRLLRRVIVNGADMPLCFDDSQKDTNLSGIVFYKILIPKEKNQTKANMGGVFRG